MLFEAILFAEGLSGTCHKSYHMWYMMRLEGFFTVSCFIYRFHKPLTLILRKLNFLGLPYYCLLSHLFVLRLPYCHQASKPSIRVCFSHTTAQPPHNRPGSMTERFFLYLSPNCLR